MRRVTWRPAAVAGLMLAATIVVSACGDEPAAGPVPAPGVVGAYVTTAFTTSRGGITTDRLAQGITLTIRLASDGSTEGSLAGPPDVSVDMGGTWALSGTTVTFTQDADTFVALLPFEVIPDGLQAEGDIEGTQFRITLRRVEDEALD